MPKTSPLPSSEFSWKAMSTLSVVVIPENVRKVGLKPNRTPFFGATIWPSNMGYVVIGLSLCVYVNTIYRQREYLGNALLNAFDGFGYLVAVYIISALVTEQLRAFLVYLVCNG